MNLADRVIQYFSPVRAFQRRKARELLNSYDGASKSKRSLKEWQTTSYDADSDILPDLESLRDRSRDLRRNNPIADGAIKTKITNVIGAGLRLQSRIDRDALNMTDEAADEWESKTEREWKLFWDSKDLDVSRTTNGHAITRLVYDGEKTNGDAFVLMPRIENRGPYGLKLQVIESDRISNKDSEMDSDNLAGGVQKDDYGAPVAYHIQTTHPGSLSAEMKWETVPAFNSATGLRNVIHYYQVTRPGQTRGVPDLAAIIEPLKQLGKYTEAEITAAVISGMFSVFLTTQSGDTGFDYSKLGNEVGQESGDRDLKLAPGMVTELAEGESVHDSNPGRPNQNFDPFVVSIMRQIGMALEIPYQILIKHFSESYSSARAAMLDFWKYVSSERRHLSDNFLKLVYENWMYEAVAIGRIDAPGYFSDPAIQAAYLGCEFIGPSKGMIDENKEVQAAALKVEKGFSTISSETALLTGGDWETNHRQQVKEKNRRDEDGLNIQPVTPTLPVSEDKEDEQKPETDD